MKIIDRILVKIPRSDKLVALPLNTVISPVFDLPVHCEEAAFKAEMERHPHGRFLETNVMTKSAAVRTVTFSNSRLGCPAISGVDDVATMWNISALYDLLRHWNRLDKETVWRYRTLTDSERLDCGILVK